jgi:Glycosyl hydrolase family 26
VTRGSVFLRRRAVSAALTTAVAATAVAIPVLSGSTATASTTQFPGLSAGHTLSGAVIRGVSAANTFGNWRHSPVTVINDYTNTDNWANIVNVANQHLASQWAGLNAHHVWSVPLIPMNGSSSLEAGAAGANDGYFATMARGFVADGDANATIRIGWEASGNWFIWNGLKDPNAYIGAFQHAVTAMRSAPGQHFTFDFSVAVGQSDPSKIYPGDNYVDVISSDLYDGAWAVPANNHPAVWNNILQETGGLNWLANFSAAHGKRIGFAEWGVNWRCDGHGGGDDPYFIDQMRSWINNHDVAYETYFEAENTSCNQFALTDGHFPSAAAEYVKDWSGASNVVTNPVSPVAGSNPPAPVAVTPPVAAPPASGGTAAVPAVPLTGLLLSYNNDRSSPVALANATVSKSAYIYYAPSSQVSRVVFSLDGKPYRAETTAAYDLVGTVGSHAKPFLPTKLKAGKHTIGVTATSSSGAVTKVSATFTVRLVVVKTLTTRLLRVSSNPAGRTAVRLDKATLHGTKYLIFPKVTGQATATYILDGKVVRLAKANANGVIKVKTLKIAGLRRGFHHLRLQLVSKSGAIKNVRAKFVVK